ncbi:uncharacterized protein LOC136037590 [Artemia franciscana]|uniref:uncharacterized protein LOC136037590 n=1 Tax=Artemia franciscana TaxID=6661 RepID=UPI0032DA90CA
MVVVDLDVDAAFDSVVHRQILKGVMEAGIKGQLLAFTYSYLQGREVTVKVGGTVSIIFVKRRCGDRQGSALGPDYYNIAEFDISIQEGGSQWMIFADDNSLYALTRTLEESMEILDQRYYKLNIGLTGLI